MATIGIDSQAGLGAATFQPTGVHILMDNFATYTPSVAENVTEVGIQKRTGDSVNVEIGVYRIDTNALIGSAVVNSSAATTREVTAITLALTAGVTYAVGFRWIGTTVTQISYANAGCHTSALTGSSALANPFVEVAAEDTKFGIFATTLVAPAFSVDTITSSVAHGGSGTFTYTGLGTISSMTVDGIAVASVSGTGGSGTFTMPSLTNGATISGYGSKAVVITGSLGSASTTITVVAPSTKAYVTETTVNSSTDAYIAHSSYGWNVTTDDTFTYDTAATLGVVANYIGDDSSVNTDYTGSQVVWLWNHTTKVVSSITITTGVIQSSSGNSSRRLLIGIRIGV